MQKGQPFFRLPFCLLIIACPDYFLPYLFTDTADLLRVFKNTTREHTEIKNMIPATHTRRI